MGEIATQTLSVSRIAAHCQNFSLIHSSHSRYIRTNIHIRNQVLVGYASLGFLVSALRSWFIRFTLFGLVVVALVSIQIVGLILFANAIGGTFQKLVKSRNGFFFSIYTVPGVLKG